MSASTDALAGRSVPARQALSSGWSSRLAFVLAAAGSAVGLGNIWKFPYIVGEYGGGAFVLVYLACVAAIGLPILLAEIAIGRRGGSSPVHCISSIARAEGHSSAWRAIGWIGMASALLILSFYSVVAGWSLSYLEFAIDGRLSGAGATLANDMSALFDGLLANPLRLAVGHSLVMGITLMIVSRGIRAGLEKAVRWMVPGLLLLLLGLVVYAAVTSGHFGAALGFLFRPDFARLNGESVLVALGHAFFTLSVGLAVMMAYGAFLKPDVSIARSSVAIASLDTLVALMAGLAIFPIVFANGLEPGAGPGLIFVTLPIAFAQIPGGLLVATLFFLFLAIAALSSTISLLEPVVEYLERSRGFARRKAAALAAAGIWLLGLGSVASFNVAADVTLFGRTFFDLLDFVTANILLPSGGLLTAIYAGRVLTPDSLRAASGLRGPMFTVWRWLLRYVTPVCVAVVLVSHLI